MNSSKIGTWLIVCVLASLLAPGAIAGKGEAYGEPLTKTKKVSISKLMAAPDDYVGKNVKVEGLVTGVCPKRGCWMTLAAKDKEFTEIKIKVDDGVIVFPMEAKGKRAVAEGVLTKKELTLEQTVAYKQHHAEEHGEEFDPASVTEGMTYYQIQGTGAVIR